MGYGSRPIEVDGLHPFEFLQGLLKPGLLRGAEAIRKRDLEHREPGAGMRMPLMLVVLVFHHGMPRRRSSN
jgi:hypothetical protein